MPITLAELVVPATPSDAIAQELLLATDLGLPTTAWDPVSAIPVVINIQGTIISDYSLTAAQFAQGGYASLAALMTDSSGNPITTWMQLRAKDQYNVTAFPATFASGSTPYANTSSQTYPYSPNNPLHFQHPTTGAKYTSTGTGNLVPGGGSVTLQADVVGSSSTAGAGVTLVLLTPFNGVSTLAITTSIVGANAETNGALLTRCQAKLGTIDNSLTTVGPVPFPGSPATAYFYCATSIPQGTTSTVPPYAVSSPITRVSPPLASGNGDIAIYYANANGPVSSADSAAVNAALNALIVPDGVDFTGASAVAVAVNLTVTVYVKQSSGLTSAQIIANIEDDLALYFAGVPIGGFSTTAANIIPTSDIAEQITLANAGTVDVTMIAPTYAAPVSLGASGLPQLGTATITVIFV